MKRGHQAKSGKTPVQRDTGAGVRATLKAIADKMPQELESMEKESASRTVATVKLPPPKNVAPLPSGKLATDPVRSAIGPKTFGPRFERFLLDKSGPLTFAPRWERVDGEYYVYWQDTDHVYRISDRPIHSWSYYRFEGFYHYVAHMVGDWPGNYFDMRYTQFTDMVSNADNTCWIDYSASTNSAYKLWIDFFQKPNKKNLKSINEATCTDTVKAMNKRQKKDMDHIHKNPVRDVEDEKESHGEPAVRTRSKAGVDDMMAGSSESERAGESADERSDSNAKSFASEVESEPDEIGGSDSDDMTYRPSADEDSASNGSDPDRTE